MSDLPKYTGTTRPDVEKHDGGLRRAVGASNYQITRADRHRPERCEGRGFTYNHAPDLTYFRGRFYVLYLGNPRDEHVAPGASFLVSSADGAAWSAPREIFPPYRIPAGVYRDADGAEHVVPDGIDAVMHQRMAFYQTGGRLLALGFYGNPTGPHESPFDRNGIGRVVREVYADGGFSPIYFLRFSRWAGWREEDLNYPVYTAAPDAGFVAACEALLADKAAVQQWLDEHGPDDELLSLRRKGLSAFCWYSLGEKPCGETRIGLFKWGMETRSDDGGRTWREPAYEPSFVMPGSKIWAQRTADGRYAAVWTPTHAQNARWPLAAAPSEDGLAFTDMFCVHGEVPYARYRGACKDSGPQYMRGICEGMETPDDGCLWVTYSVNKEDIWISRVPLPLRGACEEAADDDFSAFAPSKIVPGWNVYSPLRCPVETVRLGGRGYLQLKDADHADYARADRIFRPETTAEAELRFQVARLAEGGSFWFELCDARGGIAAAVRVAGERMLEVLSGLELSPLRRIRLGRTVTLKVLADCGSQFFTLWLDGERLGRYRFSYPVFSVERAVLRTGPRRTGPAMSAHMLDDQGYTRDVTAEEDAERFEVLALVESFRSGAGTPEADR